MSRLLISLIIGLVIGVAISVILGWGPFKVVYENNPASSLDAQYKADYTIMIASGFLVDGDALAAVERLRILEVSNVPEHVRELTEQYITLSRDIEDIRRLVSLYEGLTGELTPIMVPYRLVNRGETP